MDPFSQISLDLAPSPVSRRRGARRTALACQECRGKKRRCDGVKPVCGTCKSRLSRCVWREARYTTSLDRDSYIDGLRRRIHELEEAQARSVGTTACPPPVADSESRPEVGIRNEKDSSQRPRADRLSIRNLTTSRQSTPEGGEVGVDAMGIVSSIKGINDTHAGRPHAYFGPSSTVNLLSEARTAMCRRPCGHGPLISGHSEPCRVCENEVASFPSPSSSTTRKGGREAMFGWSVPLRAEADSLLDSYWAWVHSLYPFIHQTSFEKRYLTVWNSQNKSRSVHPSPSETAGCYDNLNDELFYCLLNIVFALGTLFNPSIDPLDRDRLSRPFFERSKALLDLDALAQGSLPLVQTLLLMGQYLQSTDMSSSCWNIVGLAIRVAQGIGLHHEPRGRGRQPVDQLDTEMRRRAWTGCVFLDRVLALAYGRPLMIHLAKPQDQLVLPSAVDDEFLTRHPQVPGSQPEGIPSKMECYVQAIKLKEIMGQVLTTCYDGGPEDKNNDSVGPDTANGLEKESRINGNGLQAIFDVDGLLTAWHNQLPEHLRVLTYQDECIPAHSLNLEGNLMFRRQATVLEARYLHVRLVMLRPVLTFLASDSCKASLETHSLTSNMRHDQLVKAANSCVSVAQRLVNLVTENFSPDSDLLPAPWYNVFFLGAGQHGSVAKYSNPRRRKFSATEPTREMAADVDMSGGQFDVESLIRNNELPSYPLFHDCFGLDQAYNPLMSDASGVTWLSFAPFLDSMEDFGE
ncbi:fungal-specific transcription factor domain-containing protein [Dactylonectria estremocensis]|uniref:Fungal-specific transcription factor domain-containing protein n=1 Tax=Dactylonectria estremocensis TaxID=1079267 RepID=A0A9P9EQK8_9HYPO|nr:fungal-specific transcription factor domain-containing protein [Dactylonectria estremocensis]